MIRTITVCAGENVFAQVAQQHALDMATLFEAHLRGVVVWDAADVERIREAGIEGSMDQVAEQELEELLQAAAQAGVTAEGRTRGEGLTQGLLAEARECDLLVLGMPTEGLAKDDPLARAIQHDELPLLRQAESSVLVVCAPPQSPRHLLVSYQGGTEGKAALRLAGHIGERAEADVHVLAVQRDLVDAETLTATAEQYLKPFDVQSIDTIERVGTPESEAEVLDVARDVGASLILIGDEPYGLLERFFGQATAERIALVTDIPVLVAR